LKRRPYENFSLLLSSTAGAYFERDGKQQLTPQEEECLERYVAFLTAMETLSPNNAAAYEAIMSSGRYSACEIMNFIEKRRQNQK
jgi:hypothetical protein